jgi:hypothetical protein
LKFNEKISSTTAAAAISAALLARKSATIAGY